jgi:diacylglycerol diphosphate phosphatase/phosphatidate phosphatase
MIAISRLEDYRHDVGDVVTGSTLGFTVAYFNWRRYFPSLLAKGCDEPHPSPDGGSSNGGFRRVRDEEESLGRNVEQYNLGDE